MTVKMMTVQEYADRLGKTARWVQLKCKAGEKLPGIIHYEQWQRIWILTPSVRFEMMLEKYFQNN